MPGSTGELVVESFPLTYDGHTYPHSRIAYVAGRPPAPAVLVHPNYAGLKQFDVDVASFLARAGYVGVAVDLYKDVPGYSYADRDPRKGSSDEAVARHWKGAVAAYMGALRSPKHLRGLLAAYLDKAYAHPAVAAGLGGAVGYCFGGQSILEQVRAGHNLQAVVTFHGLLHSRPSHRTEKRRLTAEEYRKEVDVPENTYSTKCKVLIENGDHDNEVPQESIEEWKKEMDAQKIDWRFNNHSRTPHGFALAPGLISTAYTEAADRRSTLSMLSLFAETWPQFPQYPVASNACGTVLGQYVVPAMAKL